MIWRYAENYILRIGYHHDVILWIASEGEAAHAAFANDLTARGLAKDEFCANFIARGAHNSPLTEIALPADNDAHTVIEKIAHPAAKISTA